MTLSAQISRPSDRDLHIVALLSTESGRRSAMVSSIQCLLSVVGSMGIILLFAGIPQLIYSPVVTATNVVIFLVGALLLSVMVAGNACISYRFRPDLNQISSSLAESADAAGEDKPPSYDDLSFQDGAPPDYYSVVCDSKNARSSIGNVEVAPTHARAEGRRNKSYSRENSCDSLWNSVQTIPRSMSLSTPDALSPQPEVLSTGASVSLGQRATYPDIYDSRSALNRSRLSPSVLVNPHAANRSALSASVSNSRSGNRAAKKSDSTASCPEREMCLNSPKGNLCSYSPCATAAAVSPVHSCVTPCVNDVKLMS